ncbi:MAG: hypothetical protein GTO18_16530 [Anaerolineales bacterium]|nr:hypothetical protein [Anaerolineales bacterium]
MEEQVEHPSHLRAYILVFLVLVVITAIELGLTLSGYGSALLFILLSLAKAVLVAAFYMHLRYDKIFYTYILLLPSAMFVLFALLTVAS